MQLADRVSVNLEAPNNNRLSILAPHKQFTEELLQPLKWIEEIRRTQPGNKGWNGRWPSSVTQFVAGGAGESDLELLTTTDYLYRQLGLRRTYFSPFSPSRTRLWKINCQHLSFENTGFTRHPFCFAIMGLSWRNYLSKWMADSLFKLTQN